MDTQKQNIHQSKINSGLSKISLIIWKLDIQLSQTNITFDDIHKHLMTVLLNIKAILLSNSFEYEQLIQNQITSIEAPENKFDTESFNSTNVAIQDDNFSKLTQAFAEIYLFLEVDSHRFENDPYFIKLISFLHSLCNGVLDTVPIVGIALSEQEENKWMNEITEVFTKTKQQFIEILKHIYIKDEYAFHFIVKIPIFANSFCINNICEFIKYLYLIYTDNSIFIVIGMAK